MSLSVRLRHAFDAFSVDAAFEAPRGVTILFGRSGSGKSTIVNAVAGLLTPDHGRIELDGEILLNTETGLNPPPHRRRIGYIFQDARLFPHLTVRRNLLYGRWFAPRAARHEDMDRIVEMLGLGRLLGRRPGHLSGGERQRVAIGRALLAAPRLILADEPLASLDEPRKAEILPYFERLRDEISVPILYVSHSGSEVARLATTVVALEDGRVSRQGTAAEVLGDPMVMPLGVRNAGAVLEVTVAAHHPDGLSELDAAGIPLLLPRVPYPVSARIRIRIPAQDVILARERPVGLSALNVIPATVESIREGGGPGAIVSLSTGAGRVLARITKRSAEMLDLSEGGAVFAIVKTLSIAPEDIGGER
ncbi:MAG: molybdenum ABC transporter ATP-binding protein [Pseudomonadota bacterium]